MRFESVRLRVILLVLLMTVPLVLLGMAGSFYYQDVIRQNINNEQLGAAKTIAAMTPEYMNASELYLKSIADRPLVIKAMEENNRSFLRQMAEYADSTNRVNSVYFTDDQGNIIESTPEISGSIGNSAIKNNYVGSVLLTGNPVIGDAEHGYDRMPVVPIGVPVKDQNGTVLGAMVGTVDLSQYSETIRDIIVENQQYIYLVNRTGHVIVHHNPKYMADMTDFSQVPVVQHVLHGDAGVAEYYNSVENQSRLGAYAPVNSQGWGVVVAMPVDVAYQPVWNAIWLMAAIIAIFALMAIILGLYVGNGIAVPIARLSQATKSADKSDVYRKLLPTERKDEIGELARSFGTMMDTIQLDIDERKRAAEALSESEARFRALADNIPNLAWMADADGWIFWYNKQWYTYTGTTLEEMQWLGWQKLLHPDYQQKVTEEWQTCIRDGQPYDNIFPLRGADGNYRWFLTRVMPIRDESGKIVRWFGTNTDITESKRIEEALKESMEREQARSEELAKVLDAVPAAVWIARDPQAIRIDQNRLSAEWLQIHRDANASKSAPEGERPETFRIIKNGKEVPAGELPVQQAAAGIEIHDYEFTFLYPDGAERHVLGNATPLRDEQGNPRGSVAAFMDITRRKLAEEAKDQLMSQLKEKTSELLNANEELEVKSEELAAQAEEIECTNEELRTNNDELQMITNSLRETQDYLESLFTYANAPIIVWDPKFNITRFNRAFERLSGYTAIEVLDKDLSILFPKTSREESLGRIKKTLEGEQWESVEIPILNKHGGVRIVLWNSANIYDRNNKLQATIAQGQDITLRKKAEKDLEEAKMQAELYLDLMGHDISNMHQIMTLQLEMAEEILRTEGKLGSEDKELIEMATKTLDKAARLIDNVRKLQKLKSGEYCLETMNLDRVLQEVLKDYTHIPGKDITIKYRQGGESLVHANPLLKDVFSNIVDNALKHSGGPLVLGIDVSKVAMNGGAYYRVALEDNGSGIPDDKKEEVFHRFKRGQTKARGTGLGLYLVKTLVESFGGYVEIQNRIIGDYSQGTRFLIYLPVGCE